MAMAQGTINTGTHLAATDQKRKLIQLPRNVESA